MAAPPNAPPSYSESMQQGQGYPPPGGSYGATTGPPAGAYQPGYPPAAGGYGYDPNKPAGAYDPSKPAPQYPPQAGYPPQPGYPPPAGSIPSYHHTSTNVVLQNPGQQVVLVGGCPACRVGVLEEDFTCCGVVLAILFFPIGILCCLAMRQRRCVNCGAVFG